MRVVDVAAEPVRRATSQARTASAPARRRRSGSARVPNADSTMLIAASSASARGSGVAPCGTRRGASPRGGAGPMRARGGGGLWRARAARDRGAPRRRRATRRSAHEHARARMSGVRSELPIEPLLVEREQRHILRRRCVPCPSARSPGRARARVSCSVRDDRCRRVGDGRGRRRRATGTPASAPSRRSWSRFGACTHRHGDPESPGGSESCAGRCSVRSRRAAVLARSPRVARTLAQLLDGEDVPRRIIKDRAGPSSRYTAMPIAGTGRTTVGPARACGARGCSATGRSRERQGGCRACPAACELLNEIDPLPRARSSGQF